MKLNCALTLVNLLRLIAILQSSRYVYGEEIMILKQTRMESQFRLSFGLLMVLTGSGSLLGQEALILPPAGDPIVVSVEDRRVYQALYSNDLENWNSVGDLFLPSPIVPWEFPNDESGFLRLIPNYHLDEIELRVVIVGDSTVADLSGLSIQLHGWGQVMADFFQPDVLLSNQAGTSVGTERFLERKLIERVERVKPHAVLMQFGHIDDDRNVSEAAYEQNMREIIDQVRAIGAIPIVVTPVARRLFDASDNLVNVLSNRRDSLLEVTEEKRVTIIDLNQKSTALFQKFGHDQTTFVTVCGSQCDDQSHFSRVGSYVIAGLAAESFPPLLQAFRVPLSQVTESVVAAFENDRKFESLSTPFVELTGHEDRDIWDWVFWDKPPVLP
jgi:lysophospholipase L1-like esterase